MIVERIQQWAQSGPDRTAVVHDGTPVSYAAFAGAIEGLRAHLGGLGLAPGRVAVVAAPVLLECWTIVLALRALGLTTVAVSASLAELGQLALRDVECVVVPESRTPALDLAGTPLAGTRIVTVPSPALSARPRAAPDPVPFGGHIVYTAAATGTFNKLLMRGDNDAARNDWWIRRLAFDRDTVFHTAFFGLWTAVGFGYAPAVWQAGGCMVFDQRKEWLRHIGEHGVTGAFLIPSMLAQLLEVQGDRPSLDAELVVSGGFLPLELAERTLRGLARKLTIIYASTECIAVLHSDVRGGDDVQWLTPYDERVVHIVDEDGNECAAGAEGDLRIQLRDTDASEYLDDPATTARFFRDGCYYPGDRAVRRADGRIRILGRTSEVLNVRGIKMAVAPLEDAIQRHLQVEAVCLFSGLNEQGEEKLVVAIESPSEVPKHKLDALAKLEALAPVVQAFRGFRYVVLKEFPRTRAGAGSIARAALRTTVLK